jgi:16S rRNA (guanine966-N2)-methyltransferase
MRILGGKWKGRILQVPKGKGVRPTTARVRQRIFDCLASYWQDSIGVDAFAGSGMIGLEALSRGAKKVSAIECNASHFRCIEANAKTLLLQSDGYQVSKAQFEHWWQAQSNEYIASLDWIYLDPPYNYTGLNDLIRLIVEHPAVRDGTIVIIEHGNSPTEKEILHTWIASQKMSLYKQLDCGDTGVWILETMSSVH